jgi:PAS domain S-box-containing protein
MPTFRPLPPTLATSLRDRKPMWIGGGIALFVVFGILNLFLPRYNAPPPLPHNMDAAVRTGNLMFGLFTGVLVTACLYLIIIWRVMRDKSQLWLIGLLVALAVNMALRMDGVVGIMGVPDGIFTRFLSSGSMVAFYIFGTLFTISFLELDVYHRTYGDALRLLTLALCALLPMTAVYTNFVTFFLPLLNWVMGAIFLMSGVLAKRQKIPGSELHIMAFSILLIGTLGAPAQNIGLLPPGLANDNLQHIASAIASLVFAVGIAAQFGARQEERERQLSVSNERFQLAARGSNEGLYDWDLTSGQIYFSDRFKRILGSDLDGDMRGLRSWFRLIHPADKLRIRRRIIEFLRGSSNTISLEYRVIRPDQKRLWLYSTGVAMRHPRTGRVIRLVGSTGDVTAKKQAEMEMRASETRFRSITEAHPVPVIILRISDGILVYASPGAETMFGAPLAAMLQRPADRFFGHPLDRMTLFNDLTREAEVNMRELPMMQADGTPIPVALSARLIDYEGRKAAVIGLYDLTEQKRAEDEIVKQRQALLQNEKMAAMGTLLAGVAHELNNPLSVVVGQASLLQETATDPKTQSRAEKIHKAADRCARIVKNFLALARKREPERAEVAFNSVVEGAIELVAYPMKSDGIELILDLAPDLPPVLADADQLNQVVTNLLINARQAMQATEAPKQVRITSKFLADTGLVLLSIADNGPGVPPNIKSRIFEPFFTTKQAGAGTGIGLSLCVNIIEAHGGTLTLHDTEGGGATFNIRIPASQHVEGYQKAEEAPLPPIPPQRVLLVDDEPELAQTLAEVLTSDGHTVEMAIHGQDALDKLAVTPYDIIVSDLRMPVLDGPGLYRKLQTDNPAMSERIIFVTGDTLSPHVRDFLENNPVTVIDKPYTGDDVKRAIATVLHLFGTPV